MPASLATAPRYAPLGAILSLLLWLPAIGQHRIGPKDGGTLGKSSILHDLRDLAFDAGGGNSCPSCPCRYSETCPQANFSIYAKSITRSDFTRLSFYNAKVAAVSIAYGWINRIRDSLFADNNIGLHAWNQCNNLDITGNSASRVPFD